MEEKKGRGRPRGKRDLAELERRRLSAWQMARKGVSSYKIGEVLGVSQHTAWLYVRDTLEALRGQTLEVADDWRNAELAKIDSLYDVLVPDFSDERPIEQVCAEAVKNHGGYLDSSLKRCVRAVMRSYQRKYKAIETAIKLIERRCKLLGLDAPTHQIIEIGGAAEAIGAFLLSWCERHAIAEEARREIAEGLRQAVGIQTQGALPGTTGVAPPGVLDVIEGEILTGENNEET